MWTCTLDVPAAAGPRAEALVSALGVNGFQRFDADTGHTEGRVALRFWWDRPDLPAAVRRFAARPGRSLAVAPADPVADWTGGPIGRRFFVVGPADDAPVPAGRVPLRLDPSRGFGDGSHPTTALCVSRLEAAAARRRGLGRVLDVGTGSGVLAVVAALLGARQVVATDLDPLARAAARDAAAAHGLRFPVRRALPPGPFDLVVANLTLQPVLSLASALAGRLAPGGTLWVSGFPRAAENDVAAALSAAGLRVGRPHHRAGWSAVPARAFPPRTP